jgi:putative tricarboxylic transport membrane protein
MELFATSLVESFLLLGSPSLLMFVTLGVLWGALAGALPGVTGVIAIGVAVPFTFGMEPINVVAFLIAVNVGVAYGNSIPAILVGLPGTPAAVLTAMDGFALHKQGKSGLALGVMFFAAVVGQFISIFFFLAMVVPLSQLTYYFLAPEMFALYFLGVTAIVSLTSDNILKGLASVALGLVISTVGRDPLSAVNRFSFGYIELRAGINVIPVVIGLLAVSELYRSMRQTYGWGALTEKFVAVFPKLADFKRVTPSVLVGTVIGSVIGSIPGVSGTAAAVISYQQAKIWSKKPEEFGRGSVEGIAANESAQNASQAGELVPTFGLGIPAGGPMVILLGALLMHGFLPGPNLIKEAPELLYASAGGLLAGTLILALIGWPIARVILKLVTFDRTLVLVGALFLTLVGVFTIQRSMFDVFLVASFGVLGYFMMRYGYSTAGAAMGVVLGFGFETHLRGGILLVNGDLIAFFSRPWTAAITAVALALLAYGTFGTIKLARRAAAVRRDALQQHLTSKSSEQS